MEAEFKKSYEEVTVYIVAKENVIKNIWNFIFIKKKSCFSNSQRYEIKIKIVLQKNCMTC